MRDGRRGEVAPTVDFWPDGRILLRLEGKQMAWEYSEKTKRIFMDAVQGKPGTHLGEIEDADGAGQHGSIVCGDALKFTFRVRRNEDPLKDIITEAKYLTFGCTSAIAASEALCALIEGHELTPIAALQIKNQDIVDFLELAEHGEGVRIFIGSENKLFSLSGSSLVVSPYMNSDRKIIGAVGVIGPTRLNYGRIVPIVDYTAQLVGRALSGLKG